MQPHSPTKDRARNRSLWGSYKGEALKLARIRSHRHVPPVLPARTRLYISMGVCTLGVAGLFVSDYLEKTLPPTPRGTAKSPST
ncbi:hypothetical protein M404DRAFT_997473 [Pisolithus tinctorius Marx 270]|uniref:Uncharacterized protein n=1 Tax=Pisolithus tinctorius Marx 270 TaxID=870435 RepID=A0A0C3JHH3_PISTI|nr:hypothetical protein M404DRAFT_997473 [Pisolithus tinctorius Marx 270]